MFADYQAKVFEAYRKLRATGPISSNLKVPSPAKLRNECERVIGGRCSKEDREILSSFFGEQTDLAGYVAAIRNVDIDLFRPLEGFMKGNIKNTDPKNIELLAWLIDFKDRPYRVVDPYLVSNGVNRAHKENFANESQVHKSKWARPVIFSLIALSVILAASYFFKRGPKVTGTQHCMYWTGDHYQPIDCNEKPDDSSATVMALDSDKLMHFKRITQADTLTASSIGKVWYININGRLEFYTAPGEPPSHPGRRLLPLSLHILDKYPRTAG